MAVTDPGSILLYILGVRPRGRTATGSPQSVSDTLHALYSCRAVSTQQYTTYHSQDVSSNTDPDPEIDAHASRPHLVSFPSRAPWALTHFRSGGGTYRPPPRTTADLSRPHLTLSHTTFRGPHPTESPRGRTGSPQTHSRTLADRIYTVTLDTTSHSHTQPFTMISCVVHAVAAQLDHTTSLVGGRHVGTGRAIPA